MIAYAIYHKANRTELSGQIQPLSNLQQPNVSSTPDPFVELTIPHLRSRIFSSSLSELKNHAQYAAYTSFLTSYQSDGLNINGLLTQPKGEMPQGGWPAIIFIHGYIPPAQYRTTQNYGAYVDYLAKNGFVVFKIDLRGHDKSEGEAGGSYFSSDYIIDVLNARSALQQSGFVKPDGIGLWGHSMAGNVVLRALTARPDIPAVVIWAGAVFTYEDRLEYGINDGSYRPPPADSERQRKRQLLRDIHGEFDAKSPFWQQVSPVNYLSDIQGAIQLHHAVDDNVVNIGYSRNLNHILDTTSVPHELNEYPSGGHNISGATFTQAMQKTVDFFRNNL